MTISAARSLSYDPQTRAVTGISLSDNQPSPQVDDTAYAYNAGQQVTKITDTQGAAGAAPTETQCFAYDGLSRLTQAWTSSDACAADPATGGNSTVSGPQPYWQSWTFDAAGDITSRADHAVAGSSSGTDTTTYSYAAAGHAHAVSQTSTVNSVTGATTTASLSYDGDGQVTALGGQALAWNPGGTLKSPVARNFTKLRVNHALQTGLDDRAPFTRDMRGGDYREANLRSSLSSERSSLLARGTALKWAGRSLAVAGGAIAAYGEHNSTHGNWTKTVAVGVGVTAVGIGAGVLGSAVAGSEWGAAVGSFLMPGLGTAGGAVVGAVAGAVAGWVGSNVVSDIVNWL